MQILDAHEVPHEAMALVRDDYGTYFLRHGRFGQTARGCGPVYGWGEMRRFPWFTRGRFELVAIIELETPSAELRSLIGDFEATHGVVDFANPTIAVDAR